jgi:hypothetical protein
MRSKGYSFGVSRIFEEVCRVDSAGPQTVANAWAAGFAHMDVRHTQNTFAADSGRNYHCQTFKLPTVPRRFGVVFSYRLFVCLILCVPVCSLFLPSCLCQVYLFPSYGCGVSAAGQVDAAINAMGNVPFGTLWCEPRKEKHMHGASDHDR